MLLLFALFPNVLLATQISRPLSLMGSHLFQSPKCISFFITCHDGTFQEIFGTPWFSFCSFDAGSGFGVGCFYLLIFSMFLCGFFLFPLVGWKKHELAVSILFTCQRWNSVSRKYQGVGVFSGLGVFS